VGGPIVREALPFASPVQKTAMDWPEKPERAARRIGRTGGWHRTSGSCVDSLFFTFSLLFTLVAIFFIFSVFVIWPLEQWRSSSSPYSSRDES
jgi:hypothetical protein